MRSILVTGGAGYIGSHIALDLAAHGYRPVIIDNLSTGDRALVQPGVPLVVADIADGEAVRRVLAEHGIEDVVHCAASLRVDESMRDPFKYWRNNVAASMELARACAEGGVKRIVFSSTAAVYGDTEVQPVTEDVPPHPISPYGTTKLSVEMLLADVCRASGLAGVALRYFNVAGADADGRAGASSHAEPSLIRVVCQVLLGERDHLDVYGDDYATRDGSAVRDYIHVSDLANAHTILLQALERQEPGRFITLNCGYGTGVTVREVADAAGKVAGAPLPVRMSGRRPGDIAAMVADSTRLRSLYEWRPRHADLETIIADSLRWERKLLAKRR